MFDLSAPAAVIGMLARSHRSDAVSGLLRHAGTLVGASTAVLFERDARGILRASAAEGAHAADLSSWPADAARELPPPAGLRAPRVVEVPAHHPLARALAAPHLVAVPIGGEHGSSQSMLVLGAAQAPAASRLEQLAEVGDALALVLELRRLQRAADLQRQSRRLLQSFTSAVSGTPRLEPSLETLCRDAKAEFGAGRVSAWIHRRRARELRLVASSDPEHIVRSEPFSTLVALDPLVVTMRGGAVEVVRCGPLVEARVPLKGRRRALGLLLFDGLAIDPGSEADLIECLDDLGRQVSGAIENLQLLDELLRSRSELENTFNSIADLVAVSDRELRLVHVNQAFANCAGRQPDELLDRPLALFVGAETAAWIESLDLTRPLAAPNALTREIDDPALNGTYSITVTPLQAQGAPVGSVTVARDISSHARLEAERAALRDRLAQSEKLAALGQFVAGIAHELNNPLQGVLGHLELLRATGSIPRTLRRDLQLVYREADRAAKIVRNLLVFAGSRRLAKRRVNLNVVLSRALALRTGALRAIGTEVVRDYDEAIPRLMGDPLLLQQAFLNIIMNAEQAISEEAAGRIEIKTSYARERGLAIVRVRDTGPGIPPEHLPRVFEPFFTTKDVGKGTGLGLAITYGILQEHGGQIVASNHPEGGAVITVELPVRAEVIK
jgi:PAS domain S-box-containing protein